MSATCEEKSPALGRMASASVRPALTSRRVWRIVRTGFAFAVFMGLSLLFALFVFPLVGLLAHADPAVKSRRIRRMIHRMFGRFLRLWTFLGMMRPPAVAGLRTLESVGPCIIVANHPTLIDAVLMGSLVPDFNCVVKHTLRDHTFLGGPVRAAGWVTNDDPLQVIRSCRESFSAGRSLIIFPEGSRSTEKGLRPFSRGVAQLALRSGVPLVPAVIRCDPPTLMKHQRWHDVPEQTFRMSITFHPPLAYIADGTEAEPLPRKARRFTDQIEEFFRKELSPAPDSGSSRT